MSSYSRLAIIFVILIFTSIGCAKQYNHTSLKKKINYQEDLLLMLALDSENTKKYNYSFEYYKRLYKLSHKVIFLKKAIAYSYKIKKFKEMLTLSQSGIDSFPVEKEYFTQQLIIANLSNKNIDEALKDAKKLLAKNKSIVNYEIMANVYYAKGDYKNSLKYYESSYAQNQNELTLLKLTTILYTYLDQKDVALAYLETYLQTKGCTTNVCNKLMLIYQEQGNINGMLSILNKMYFKYSQDPALKKTSLMVQNIIVSLLEKKDIKQAIKYLEKNKINNQKLLNLYEQNGQIKKALALTRVLYKKTRRAELLGKIAMFQFQLAKDKKAVMKHVIANFELALSSGINNASYQNYYGYLLIDFNINIKKGIKLVKAALKTSPNNIAYLDSLAWGYYKLGRCNKAFIIMKKVIASIGLNDNEIRTHWENIKKCKINKKGKK